MIRKLFGAAISGAVLVTTAGAAFADTAINDLDLTPDAELEVMNLSYDAGTMIGSTGSTVLRMRVDGPADGDRGGCNVNGATHFVTLTATSSDPNVAVLTNGPDYTFDTCDDLLTVSVAATGVGTAQILFAVTDSATSADPSGAVWSTAEADFQVNVAPGGGSTGCDADPAAPAWAAAILQKNGYKAGAKQTTNLISRIAGEMQQRADFNGVQKSDHPAYESAVLDRLKVLTGNANLVLGSRPGWTCVPIS
jgi:hypothetical protein